MDLTINDLRKVLHIESDGKEAQETEGTGKLKWDPRCSKLNAASALLIAETGELDICLEKIKKAATEHKKSAVLVDWEKYDLSEETKSALCALNYRLDCKYNDEKDLYYIEAFFQRW